MDYAVSVLALICGFLVISRKYHTGIIITIGLGCIVVSCLAYLDDGWSIKKAFFLQSVGTLTMIFGMWWKGRKSRNERAPQYRRAADFGE